MARSASFPRESRNWDFQVKSQNSPESPPDFDMLATNWKKKSKHVYGLELKSHHLAGDLRDAVLVSSGFTYEEM